jgi:hypothetical protein
MLGHEPLDLKTPDVCTIKNKHRMGGIIQSHKKPKYVPEAQIKETKD